MRGIARGWALGADRSVTRPAVTRPASPLPVDARRVERLERRSSRTETFTATAVRVLDLPLDAFAEAGQMLEIRVPWDPEPLWFVPTAEAIEPLVAEGVNPGRIWTAAALRELLAAGVTKDQARRVAETRIAFEADVVEIQPRAPAPPALTNPQLTLEGL